MTLDRIRLPLAGLPEQCPHCGNASDTWPLGVFAGELFANCLRCHVSVASVVAIRADDGPQDECEGAPDPMHEHDGYEPHSHEVRADHLGVTRNH